MTKTMIKALQYVGLFVKIVHGESDLTFKETPERTLQVGFQVNGVSPGLWIAIYEIFIQ